jgi:uncharacterized repeat protein (TIGR03803 family)
MAVCCCWASLAESVAYALSGPRAAPLRLLAPSRPPIHCFALTVKSGGATFLRLRRILIYVICVSIVMVTWSAFAQAGQCNLQVQLLILLDGNGPIWPEAGLVQDASGAFYGTSERGGPLDDGSVFKITPEGILSALVFFDNDSFYPATALTQISNDCFLGTTESEIFKIDSMGDLSNVFTFNLTNGTQPMGDLLFAKDGNLYGSTFYSQPGNGTLFKMTLASDFTTIVNFDYTNGAGPNGLLAEGDNGSLFGETSRGGAYGSGTIFEYSVSGGLTTLYSFTNGADGNYPWGGLLRTVGGDLYGVTSSGGQFGQGTVFQFSTNGGMTILAALDGTNGSYPQARLVQGADGAFYGTTLAGGTFNAGTVFRIDALGNLTTLGVFDGTNGNSCCAPLMIAQDGNLYGTTLGGGHYDYGTVFRLVAPPVVGVTSTLAGPPTLTWNSFSGAHYRIDSSPTLMQNWISLTNCVATGSNTSFAIANIGELQQFYRVVLLPW